METIHNERDTMDPATYIRTYYQLGQDDARLGDLPELGAPENISPECLDAYWRGVRDYRALTALGF
jgi:hypothetical protein